ncbi:MAG: polysaccharide export protein [Lachnospiraceae bacterium]|nr:polysaccharide export protein [Lachnospiraceae bacterium]
MNNNINNIYEDAEIEIDLREVFFAVKKWFWMIALVSFLVGAIAFGFTKLFITPIYTAENSMLVLTKETTLASLADLQMGSQLTNDYRVLTTSRPVLETVIENLELDMEYKDLKNMISISNPDDTRILVISVEHESPKLALDIVREVAKEASYFIGDMMEVVPPKIIDDGVLPTVKTSPSNAMNTLLGILIGGFLSGGIVVLRAVLDDTIKSEEDIEKYLGLSTLSSVPDRKDYINQNKDKSSKKGKGSRLKKTGKKKV